MHADTVFFRSLPTMYDTKSSSETPVNTAQSFGYFSGRLCRLMYPCHLSHEHDGVSRQPFHADQTNSRSVRRTALLHSPR